jgi:hypothetical protein
MVPLLLSRYNPEGNLVVDMALDTRYVLPISKTHTNKGNDMTVSLAKTTYRAVNTDDPSKQTSEYATPKNTWRFGLRKPDMPAGAYNIVRTDDKGHQTVVSHCYKTV